ncbi:MAG: ferredoxin [Deltaproteobacteria bacterium]|nr:ferredoxin [Deltaproteobacteria bacterium]
MNVQDNHADRVDPLHKADARPKLQAAPAGDLPLSAREQLRLIQSFFVGQSAAPALPSGLYPALLSAFRDESRVRTTYPLYLPQGEGACLALDELLEGAAPAVRLLTDNLKRAERLIRVSMREATRPVAAKAALEAVLAPLLQELSLREAHAAELSAAWNTLVQAIPEGTLLPYGEHAALQLFLHAVRQHRAGELAAFKGRVLEVKNKLTAMLLTDTAKRPEARSAEGLSRSLGGSGSLLNAGGLAKAVSQRTQTGVLSQVRRERIQRIVSALELWAMVDDTRATVVHSDPAASGWGLHADLHQADDVFTAAVTAFDGKAAQFAHVVRSLRAGELEISGSWNPDVHEPWFAGFDWQGFSRGEFMLLPVVVAYSDAHHTAAGLQSLSKLILSGRPIHVVTSSHPAENPGSAGDGASSYRLELGLVGIGLRQAFVQQSAAARPGHLVRGYLEALTGTRSSLHLVGSDQQLDGSAAKIGAWLHAGAALEGRAHPFFRFSPEQGSSFATQLDFDGNEAAEADWAQYPLEALDAGGKAVTLPLSFTYADFALLEVAHQGDFFVVPAAIPDTHLLTVSEWLSLPAEETVGRVPFVWGIDAGGTLQRVAISRRLVLLTRDRLSTWNTLQEMAGIHDPYAIQAAETAWESARAEAKAELAQLTNAHLAELERVREEEADEAMRRLTAVLLEQDFAGLAPTGAPKAAAPAAAAPAAPAPVAEAAPAAAPPAAEEEALSFDDPYIDSFLCTSCSECVNINKLLFVYDGNKQATIGDASAGSFKELVSAAEKCPARCIHPGKPKNASEPGLAELIQRATPFN